MILYISKKEDFSNSTNISSIDNKQKKEICLKILSDSFFEIEIIKTRREFIYNYKTITYNNKNENINYEDMILLKEEINEPKYLELIIFLEKLKNTIIKFKEKYNFKLIIKLNIETNKTNNDINCECKLYDKNNSQIIFRDSNIYKDEGLHHLRNALEDYIKK